MAIKHYYRDLDGTLHDMGAYAPRIGYEVKEQAEEGSVGITSVELDDPLGELDIVGHRNWFIEDDESDAADDIIFGGFTGAQRIGRLQGNARRRVGPAGRTWSIELQDANAFWDRVTMKGEDCDRDAETDVERMQWLLGTTEAALIQDPTTYMHTGAPVAMDAVDYRGQFLSQIVRDCSLQSGKNWFCWYRKVGGTRTLTSWYGRNSATDYNSAFQFSNDPADLAHGNIRVGTATVWWYSPDTELFRDPSRQYCGNYFTGDDFATYQHNVTTHAASAHRDMATNNSNVKSLAKGQARAIRMLADVAEPVLRVQNMTVELPSEAVSQIRTGMRTQFRATHFPSGLDEWHYARVVVANPKPVGRGETWQVGLELVIDTDDTSPGPPGDDFEGGVFAGLQKSYSIEGAVKGTLAYQYNFDDDPGPGWLIEPTTGPISIDQGSAPYSSITVSEPMTVRIEAGAATGDFYAGTVTLEFFIKVNGVTVYYEQVTGTEEVITHNFHGDLRDYHLDAGDVVSVEGGAEPTFWTNGGVNGTFLKVGRGSFFDGPSYVFEGP